MVLPAQITYATVNAVLTSAVVDGSDPDLLPDGVPLSGQVTFTPDRINGQLLVPNATPPLMVTVKAMPFALAVDGSFSANLVVIPGATYTVSFALNGGVSIAPFSIGPLVAGTTYDLASLAPVTAMDGVAYVISAATDASIATAVSTPGTATKTALDAAFGLLPSEISNFVAADSPTPIVPLGVDADWDTGIREIGNVVHDGTIYRMLYSGYNGTYAQNTVYVGLATSTDGRTWTKQGRLNITRSSEDPYLLRVAGVWHLFVEDKEEVPFRAIRKYHSADFVTWVDDGQILTPSAQSWEALDVSSPVVWMGSAGWNMLYEGRTITGVLGSVGYATSPNGLVWTRQGVSPVFSAADVSWSNQTVPDDVFFVDGRRFLTYHGYNGTSWGAGIAVQEGAAWRNLSRVLVSVGGVLPGVDYGSIEVMVTPDGDLLVTYGSVGVGGIYRASFASGHKATAVTQAQVTGLSSVLAGLTAVFAGATYYGAPGTRSAFATVLNRMTVVPFYVPKSQSFVRIGAEVTVAGAAGSVIRLGIYNLDANGIPTTLVVDAGTINGTSPTIQEVTISQTLAAGMYGLAAVAQVGTPTVRTITGGGGFNVGAGFLGGAAGFNPNTGYYQSAVASGLPSPCVFSERTPTPTFVFMRTA